MGAVSDAEDRTVIERAVRESLVHFQLWTDVQLQEETLRWKNVPIRLLTGFPPHKLSNDDENHSDQQNGRSIAKEYVLPVNMTQHKEEFITLECLDLIFAKLCSPDTKRIVLAIVNSDGTVVYYFIYNGIHKPKRN